MYGTSALVACGLLQSEHSGLIEKISELSLNFGELVYTGIPPWGHRTLPANDNQAVSTLHDMLDPYFKEFNKLPRSILACGRRYERQRDTENASTLMKKLRLSVTSDDMSLLRMTERWLTIQGIPLKTLAFTKLYFKVLHLRPSADALSEVTRMLGLFE